MHDRPKAVPHTSGTTPQIERVGRSTTVRMHGRETVHERESEGDRSHQQQFDDIAGARAIIEIEIERLSTSCGYSVPFLEFKDERPTLVQWASRKTPEELDAYRTEKNAISIDGLPIFPGASGS